MQFEPPKRLNLADAQVDSRGGASTPRGRVREAKILIVDDETALGELLVLILKHGGYRRIESTTDSKTAVRLAGELQPDLIVLDLMMPGVTGLDVLAELRASGARMPILVVSGDSASETQMKAQRSGASDFLAKPFPVNEILACIGRLLAPRFPVEHQKPAAREIAPVVADRNRATGAFLGLPTEAILHFPRGGGHSARSLCPKV